MIKKKDCGECDVVIAGVDMQADHGQCAQDLPWQLLEVHPT